MKSYDERTQWYKDVRFGRLFIVAYMKSLTEGRAESQAALFPFGLAPSGFSALSRQISSVKRYPEYRDNSYDFGRYLECMHSQTWELCTAQCLKHTSYRKQ